MSTNPASPPVYRLTRQLPPVLAVCRALVSKETVRFSQSSYQDRINWELTLAQKPNCFSADKHSVGTAKRDVPPAAVVRPLPQFKSICLIASDVAGGRGVRGSRCGLSARSGYGAENLGQMRFGSH